MNNPTIDGVSRELLERLWRGAVTMGWGSAQQLQDLLQAPVVERQHDCCANCMRPRMEHCGENCPAPNTSVWHAWDYDFAPGTEATPEVAALQPTIAQLEDKLNKAIDLDFQRRETIEQLQARVQELESGRGEVVYQVSDGVSGWHDVERLKFTACQLDPEEYECRMLFTAPPAPVAVAVEKYDDVLLPFLSLMRAELHANAHKGDRPGWLQMDRKTAVLEVFYHLGKLHQAVHRDEKAAIKEYAADVANMCMMLLDVCACLDATAALNTIHVGELGPAQRLALARGESFVCDISGNWNTGWTFIDANKTGEGQGVCYAFPPGLTITGKWV